LYRLLLIAGQGKKLKFYAHIEWIITMWMDRFNI